MAFWHLWRRRRAAPAPGPRRVPARYRAVSVSCFADTGTPVGGARAEFYVQHGLTNSDGQLLFFVPASLTRTTLTVCAEGYAPYQQTVQLGPGNQTIRCGGQSGQPDVVLPPLHPLVIAP